jgi:hypothetical protein
MSNQNELCFLHFDGWTEWWEDIKQGTIEMYISVVLFFLSAALGQPMARCIFFLLRKITPKTWM